MNEMPSTLAASGEQDRPNDATGHPLSEAHVENLTIAVVGEALKRILPVLEQVEKFAKEIHEERLAGGSPASEASLGHQPTLQELAQKKLSNAELRMQVRMQKIMSRKL